MTFNQASFDLRCEWGQQGIDRLSPDSDVVIVSAALNVSKCVPILVNGAYIKQRRPNP